jgi:Leucine-rich repeat (LRR) protein
LNNNHIEEIDDEAFCGSIHPIENDVRMTNNRHFRGVSNLIELDLSNNRIQLLKKNTFRGLSRLIRLNLSSNEIHEIFKKEFHCLTSLNHVCLNDNPVPNFFFALSLAINLCANFFFKI